MIATLLQEIEVTPKKVREFGWVMLIVLGGIIPSIISFKYDWAWTSSMTVLVSIGTLLFFLSRFVFSLSQWVYKAWMLLALLLGIVMTKVIITIVFYLVMTPIGLIRKASKASSIDSNIDSNASSYWKPRSVDPSKRRFEKLY